MYVSALELNNFRNYDYERFEFSSGTNVIYGDNAQGKTNILEAVYMFAGGKSHRAKSDRELIKFGSDFARLSIAFSDSERDYKAKMQLRKGGKKAVSVNGVHIKKLSKLMSYLNVVMFSPEDLELVKGSPSCRRRFIDSSVSQLYPNYFVCLTDYNKALMQKNSLLKQLRSAGKYHDEVLSVWNGTLAEKGAKIMEYRKSFIELLNKFAGGIQEEISTEKLVLEYAPSIKNQDMSEESFFEYLEGHQKREIEFASSLFGIQRDDININVNGREARLFASQGQQRTAALSMKIAQADYTEHIKGEYPVLLLDDIMSELDINRRLYLAGRIKNKQVLITCTDTDIIESSDATKLFHIKNGKVMQ